MYTILTVYFTIVHYVRRHRSPVDWRHREFWRYDKSIFVEGPNSRWIIPLTVMRVSTPQNSNISSRPFCHSIWDCMSDSIAVLMSANERCVTHAPTMSDWRFSNVPIAFSSVPAPTLQRSDTQQGDHRLDRNYTLTFWRTVVISTLVSINKVNLRRARLVLGWVKVSGVKLSVPENLSQYISSHPGQLSLAIPPWVGAMSTSQRAMMRLGSKGRYGLWAGGRCDPLAITGHIWAF